MRSVEYDAALPALDQILVTSRDFDEYLSMFGLDADGVVSGRVLDCPGGASDFTFRVREFGGQAVAVDPIYTRTPRELADLLRDELRRGVGRAGTAGELYDFSWTGGVDVYLRRRERSAQRFLADYALDRGRYLPAALPHLPFPDGSFDLALVPNLLFSYSNLFDLSWHVRAVRELVRVAREVRIHPLTDTSGRPYEELPRLRSLAAEAGIETRLIDVDYRLRRGTERTLICRPAR
ncbi:methyltransferase [Microbispora sp. RL4-1S]|uniref:Methyltransferase n=1 Tax=Microbispora oryzae TaxID=2806554 RepID=A0A940WMN2_9ACTN|nr:methyltransferase [Microbispora oryzae]MBP2708455.1 methyltransferase [Microbispora oryzae]